MDYTQIKIKKEYRDKLAELAKSHNRSMANMVEVLIDDAIDPSQREAALYRRFAEEYMQGHDTKPEPVRTEPEETA
jgi:hypothetical protein